MCKIMLVDDEAMNLEILEKLLMKYPCFNNISRHTNPFTAYSEIKIMRPDVIFMDIEMPGMNGLELAGKVMEYDATIKVVFVTSYDFYAIEAFELYAVDYILKPITSDRLAKTIKRLLKEAIIHETEKTEEKLVIKTFGQLSISKGEKLIKWQGAKTEELFAYFLSKYDQGIHKDSIIDTLWPDYDYRRALGNMQTAMYRVRQSLNEMGEHVQIDFNCNKYRLKLKNSRFDLLDFSKAIQEIRQINEDTIDNAKKALEIYPAPFLDQNGYVWAYGKQASLEKSFSSLLTKTVKYLYQNGRCLESIDLLRRIKTINPTNKKVNNLMRAIQHERGNSTKI